MERKIIKLNYEDFSMLTETEVSLLAYINENAKEVSNSTIKVLSANSFSSPASIVRFCKKIGFQSFSELKYFLKNNLSDNGKNLLVENANQIILDRTRTEMLEAFDMLDMTAVDKIVRLMDDKKILLFGKGINEYFINYLTTKLSLLGMDVIAHRDSAIAKVYADIMDKNNIVIILSISGETKEAIAIANSAKQNSCKILLICSDLNSAVAKIADFCLQIPIKKSLDNAVLTSYYTVVWILDVLIEKVYLYQKNK